MNMLSGIEAFDMDYSERILAARESAKMTQEKFAQALGVTRSSIAQWETAKTRPRHSAFVKISELTGHPVEWLENGVGDANQNVLNLAIEVKVTHLQVKGIIEAGNFRDITIMDDSGSEYETIPIPADARFPNSAQYALKVSGDSMNLKFPDGVFVSVVSLIDSGIDLKPGMTVHVEKYMGGGQYVETTLKEIQSINGEVVLIPRSTNPKYKPISYDKNEETEIHIRGVVLGMYRPEIF